jgi:AcrR family transcriptional regulator
MNSNGPSTISLVSRETHDSRDPRTRRTRQLLQDALDKLMRQKEFDRVSVQDITDAAGVNRATFYAHYPDKFALLECMVARHFNALLELRGVVFDGTCSSALRGIVLGVCDFLAESNTVECQQRQLQMEPHMEAAVVSVVRRMLLDGLKKHSEPGWASIELRASAVSGAVYGAAKEWSRTPNRHSSEIVSTTITGLLAPLLHAPAPGIPVAHSGKSFSSAPRSSELELVVSSGD